MPRDLLGKSEIEGCLRELAERLAERGTAARIYVVGGAAIVVRYETRSATRDVDAAYHPEADVEDVADTIGIERDIGPGWLNNAAVQFFPTGRVDAEATVLIEHQGVRIEIAPPDALLAMKLNAARLRDRQDIETLMRHLGITSPEQALAVFSLHYPDKMPSEDLLDRLDEIFDR